MNIKPNPEKRILTYSALAAAFFAGHRAEAEIVYTDIDPDTLLFLDTMSIDVDGDSYPDILFNHEDYVGYTAGWGGCPRYFSAWINDANDTNEFIVSSGETNLVKPLVAGEIVSQNQTLGPWIEPDERLLLGGASFSNCDNTVGNIWGTWGLFPDAGDKYIGVRFTSSNNHHYAWILVSVDSIASQIVVKEYAYENTPQLGIIAGEKETSMVSAEDIKILPNSVLLHDAYPNPFNSSTQINYSLAERTKVQLSIYDLMGKHITTLVDDVKAAGEHSIYWNADSHPAGVYILELTAGNQHQIKKITLIK